MTMNTQQLQEKLQARIKVDGLKIVVRYDILRWQTIATLYESPSVPSTTIDGVTSWSLVDVAEVDKLATREVSVMVDDKLLDDPKYIESLLDSLILPFARDRFLTSV